MTEVAVVEQFNDFILWERTTRDVIDVKKIYIDLAGDIRAGIMLSQIIYWHLPGRGRSEGKLTVHRNSQWWLVKKRHEWWEETRLTPREVDRALEVLVEKGLLVTERHQFGKTLSTYMRINKENFIPAFNNLLHNPPDNPYLSTNSRNGELQISTNLPNTEIGSSTNSPNGESLYTETTLSKTTSTQTASAVGNVTPFRLKAKASKVAAGETTKRVATPRARDEMWELVLERSYGITYDTAKPPTKTIAGRVSGCVTDLKDMGITLETLKAFYADYSNWRPKMSVTRERGALVSDVQLWEKERGVVSTTGITIRRAGE